MAGFTKTKNDIRQLTGSKRERAEKLVNKLDFMETQLRNLQKEIKGKGWVEEYQNGANQSGLKKSSAGEVYNTLIKNYTNALKQLEQLLGGISGEDELEQFLNND
jgi:hypothetical protein